MVQSSQLNGICYSARGCSLQQNVQLKPTNSDGRKKNVELDGCNSCLFFFKLTQVVIDGVCFSLSHFSVQAAVSVKALEKQLQQKKDSDPIMAGILEEVRHGFTLLPSYHVSLLIGELVTKSESVASQSI